VQLQGMTEKVHGSPSEVAAAVGWLAESRLISPGDGDGAVVVYELAHERLIPALRVVANRELSDVNKANLLLDRRVNEWLGSGKNRRYLFSLKELLLLRQQRGFLEWGQQRSQKETLVKNSWNRSRWGLSSVGTPLILGLAFGIWSYTPPGQIQWARWDLVILRNMGFREASENSETVKSITVDLVSGVGNNPFPTLWMKGFVSETYSNEEVSRIIDLVSKSKDKTSARQILRQVEIIANHFDQPTLLSNVAGALISFGDAEKGKQTLEKALENTKSIKDEYSQSDALSSIAQASGKLGDAEKGKQTLEKALEITKSIKDESSQSYALSSIAQAYGKLGDAEKGKQTLEKALEITKSIKNENNQSAPLRSIAQAYGKLGDAEKGKQTLEKALEITKSIKDEYYQSYALSSIAQAYGKLGDAEKGKQTLEKALEITKSIKDEDYQRAALSLIVKASGKLGDAEKGKQILEKTIELTKSIKTEYLQRAALSSIAQAYGKLGDAEKGKQTLEKALEFTKSIKNESLQHDALTSIALAYLELGDLDRAKVMAIDLSSKFTPELSTYQADKNLGILQAELGNWSEALRFSKRCQADGKVAVLTQILRVNAEQKHPEFKELRVEKEE
jgi:tetratricopeptide (TPR) repeat protein